jgi:hypothetical protein
MCALRHIDPKPEAHGTFTKFTPGYDVVIRRLERK